MGGGAMANNTDVSEIILFLENAKKLITEGKYDFVPRRKNMQSLALHGITLIDAKLELMDLTAHNYYRGPKNDYDISKTGDIWEFKWNINGILFYIKLKITDISGKDELKCIGFHEDGIE